MLTLFKNPELHEFQKEVRSQVYRHIKGGEKRILVVAATGSGKTILAGQITYDAAAKGKKVLFVVHRDILIRQTLQKFSLWNLECGAIAGEYKETRTAPVQIASCQTLSRRELDWFQPDVVFIDEAHLVAWTTPVRHLMDRSDAIFLGLTATPFRLKKTEEMGDLFNEMVCAPLPKDLMEMGHLCRPAYYGLPKPDLKGVASSAGDYLAADLERRCNVPEVIKSAIDNWIQLASGRRTVAFAIGVAHAHAIAQAFCDRGIPSAAVDGNTPIPERERIYKKLETGEIKVVASCNALSEGFDCPAVDCVLLCRPTKSKALYFQQVGRGLRTAKNKRDCLVLDLSGNVERFGFIESLRRIKLRNSSEVEPKEAPTKECPNCKAILYTFQMKCKCGYVFPLKEKFHPVGKLVKLLSKEDKKRLKNFQKWCQQAFHKDYQPDWADNRFREAYKEWPLFAWRQGAVFGDDPHEVEIDAYREYLERVAHKKGLNNHWIDRQMTLEFGEDKCSNY